MIQVQGPKMAGRGEWSLWRVETHLEGNEAAWEHKMLLGQVCSQPGEEEQGEIRYTAALARKCDDGQLMLHEIDVVFTDVAEACTHLLEVAP